MLAPVKTSTAQLVVAPITEQFITIVYHMTVVKVRLAIFINLVD
jgi:hypothetical protein